MIDPLETCINHVLAHPAVQATVEGRVGAKHKYAQATSTPPAPWLLTARSITLADDGNVAPDISIGQHTGRLDVRCYGSSAYEAKQAYLAFLACVRATETRCAVITQAGTALLYWLVMDTSPSQLYDSDLSLDFVQCFARYAVAETALEEVSNG